MTKNMTKLTLVALAVICSRPSGYRRAGFSLEQGENTLEATQLQYEALDADKHLTVSFVSDNTKFADEGNEPEKGITIKSAVDERFPVDNKLLIDENNSLKSDVDTHVKSERILQANLEKLREEIELLNINVDSLNILCADQKGTIKALEKELTPAIFTSSDTSLNITEVGKKVEMDFSWAPEELAPWIAVIHEIHTKTPLTKRPTVAELEVEVPAEGLAEAFKHKPTAAQADDAWAYYSDNVINHVPDNNPDTNADSVKG